MMLRKTRIALVAAILALSAVSAFDSASADPFLFHWRAVTFYYLPY
jgi:hypothetical protein